MTRRAAAGLGRLLPLLLIAAAIIVVAGAALLAACGGSSGGASPQPTDAATTGGPSETASGSASPSASPSAAPPTTVRLYFLRDGKLGVAERRIARTTMPATESLKALLAGPSSSEVSAGLSSDIPAGTHLNGLSLDGGTAIADLSPEFATPAANAIAARRVAEVVFTLTRYSTVRRVSLLIDGRPLTEMPSGGVEGSPEALAVSSSLTRSKPWTSFEPAIFVESPGAGAVISSPFTLAGTASVFEGTFQARLVDSSERRIVNVTVQAARGAPGRGRFAKEIAYSTSAKRGTLIVYAQSMEDGSRQDEVRIPISFTAD